MDAMPDLTVPAAELAYEPKVEGLVSLDILTTLAGLFGVWVCDKYFVRDKIRWMFRSRRHSKGTTDSKDANSYI